MQLQFGLGLLGCVFVSISTMDFNSRKSLYKMPVQDTEARESRASWLFPNVLGSSFTLGKMFILFVNSSKLAQYRTQQ